MFLRSHFAADEPADFHRWLDHTLDGFHERRGSRLAVIAPREGAKSTWLTLAYPLRCALEGWEPHIVLLSDSGEMATQFLSALRAELESNDLLAAVYPDACGAGAEWRGDRVRLKNGVLIKSLGRGSNIRGRKDRQNRPTLIVADDCQSNRDIDSPTDRTRTLSWFLQEVIPAGSDRTNVLSVGSALHRDALAVRVQALPGWTGRTFKAVHRWPDRMDLWTEWERLATNLGDDRRNETAAAFLAAHRAEMLAGAVSFWPAFKPIEALMRRRAEIGARRFDVEYQGVPGAAEGAEFPAEFFDRPGLWFDEWPERLLCRVQALDPSKGADAKSGDFQAHVQVGYGHDGKIYVEAVLAREIIPLMIDRALDLAAAFTPLDALAVENNDALGMLRQAFEDAIRKRARPVPLCTVFNTLPKVVRVRRLGLYFGRGQVRFRNTHGTRLLADQLRDFPNADNDDAPDALELGVRTLEHLLNPR